MSYNISNWTTVELKDLRVPETAFPDETKRWGRSGHLRVRMSEDGGVTGAVVDGVIQVESVELRGVGSGWDMDALMEALQQSSGTLVAVLVWEGGDSVELFECRDGQLNRASLDVAQLVRDSRELKALKNAGKE